MRRRFIVGTLLALACGCAEVAEEGTPDAEADVPGRVIQSDAGPAPDHGAPPDDVGPAGTDAGDAAAADAADAAPAQCADGVDNDGDGHIDLDDRGCSDAADDDESDELALPQCDNGEDDDGDGRIDLADPDCTSAADPREQGDDPTTQCNNGLDDDGDGAVDFPEDRGCAAAGDDDETSPIFVAECADEADNDGDGLIDYPADPGCQGRGDGSEADPARPPACADGLDNDEDGAIDYPADDGCASAGDGSEHGPCGERVEVIDLAAEVAARGHFDGTLVGARANTTGTCGGTAGGELVFRYVVAEPLDRLVFSTVHEQTLWPTVLYVRRNCGLPADLACNRGFEQDPGTTVVLDRPAPGTYYLFVDTGSRMLGGGPFRLTVDAQRTPACRDRADNDGDGLIDNDDPGCVDRDDTDEADPQEPPVCANGLDDDGDGAIDYPADRDCTFAGGAREQPVCPGGPPLIPVGQQGGLFELPPPEGNGGSQPTCEPALGAEVVLVITLDTPSDVTVEVSEGANPAQLAIHARTECHAQASEVACRRSQDRTPFRLEAVPRGTYYVLIEQGFLRPPVPRTANVVIESVITQCNDEVDNDGDGLIDLDDPGCEQPRDPSEADPAMPPQCLNGEDDDGDGLIDYPADPGCDAAGDNDEVDFRPPAVGTPGNVGVLDGDGWVVCRADFETAWLSANTGGHYNTLAACASVGYDGPVDMWGGTCGDVCGYCGRGEEHYDGAGGAPENLGLTVHWRCTRRP